MSSYLIANNKFSGIIINGKLIQFFIKACHKILVLVLIPLLGLYFLMELSRPKKKKSYLLRYIAQYIPTSYMKKIMKVVIGVYFLNADSYLI